MAGMERIIDVWFKEGRIYISTDGGKTLSRSLVDFPLLLTANNAQRADFRIVHNGEALRWDNIDEDIHVSSFFEPDKYEDNEISMVFRRFPQLNIKQVAQYIGINSSLLSNYVNGSKKPSAERVALIKRGLHNLGNALISV